MHFMFLMMIKKMNFASCTPLTLPSYTSWANSFSSHTPQSLCTPQNLHSLPILSLPKIRIHPQQKWVCSTTMKKCFFPLQSCSCSLYSRKRLWLRQYSFLAFCALSVISFMYVIFFKRRESFSREGK